MFSQATEHESDMSDELHHASLDMLECCRKPFHYGGVELAFLSIHLACLSLWHVQAWQGLPFADSDFGCELEQLDFSPAKPHMIFTFATGGALSQGKAS